MFETKSESPLRRLVAKVEAREDAVRCLEARLRHRTAPVYLHVEELRTLLQNYNTT